MIEMVRSLEAPYDVYVHDYAWICPRVTLIDGSGRYCGEPAVSVCHVLREAKRLELAREDLGPRLARAQRDLAAAGPARDRPLRRHRGAP